MTATNLARLDAAESVIKTLSANGIDTLYCLPGVQNDDFFDALARNGQPIKPVHTRHEQATAYMALGAALATGKPQAYCVVPGPGFLNTTTALATAQ
jgi:acetolactate synthase I/II/III large subunit